MPTAATTAWSPATPSHARGAGPIIRRRFIDAEKVAPEIAREAIEMIRMLYAVEKQARGVAADQRLALRQAQSAPVLAQIRQKLLLWKEQLLPKHPMTEAINYALSQWQEMNVFCSDGAVAIDNNASEREMKRVILNRKTAFSSAIRAAEGLQPS